MSISRRQFIAGAGAVAAAAALPAAAPASGGFLARDVRFFVGEAGPESLVPIDSMGGFIVPQPLGKHIVEILFNGEPIEKFKDVNISVHGGCTRGTTES